MESLKRKESSEIFAAEAREAVVAVRVVEDTRQ